MIGRIRPADRGIRAFYSHGAPAFAHRETLKGAPEALDEAQSYLATTWEVPIARRIEGGNLEATDAKKAFLSSGGARHQEGVHRSQPSGGHGSVQLVQSLLRHRRPLSRLLRTSSAAVARRLPLDWSGALAKLRADR